MSKFIRYSLYFLIILLPVIFFSLSNSPVAFDRQLFVSIFVLGGLILFGLGGLLGKENKKKIIFFNKGWLSNSVYLFFIISILSFIFSKSRFQSFWGTSGEPMTLLNIILYIAAFFLFSNVFLIIKDNVKEEREVKIANVLISILVGSALLALVALATIPPVKSSLIAKFYQLAGSSTSLALLLGGALIVLVSLTSWGQLRLTVTKPLSSDKKKRWSQIFTPIFTWLVLGLSLFWIIIVDSWLIWIGIALAIIIIFLSQSRIYSGKRKTLNFKYSYLPVIVLCLSLIFLFIRVPINSSKLGVPQIGPNLKLSSNITSQTLKTSPKNLFLGSGPATFGYQYELYKPASVNLGTFWRSRFSQASSSFLTLLSNLGILGIISFLLIFLIFIWQGFKSIFKNKNSVINNHLKVAIVASVVYFFFAFFLFPFNSLIWFYLFVLLALWEVINGEENLSQVKTMSFLKSSSQAISFTILGLAILVSASAIFLYEAGQRYVNQVFFARAVTLYNKDSSKIDKSISELQKVLAHNPSPLYLRNLSQFYLLKIGQAEKDPKLSQKGKQLEIQLDIKKSQQLAQLACRIDPVDELNWVQNGNVYESIVSVQGAAPVALNSYQRAQELAPTNPAVVLALGRVNLALAQKAKGYMDIEKEAQKQNKEKLSHSEKLFNNYLKSAQKNFQDVIQLKGNFYLGYYWMGKLYEFEGDKYLALQNYRAALYFQPNSKEIKAKIDELSGK